MELLQKTFINSTTEKTKMSCPKCNSILYCKKIPIDPLKYKGAKDVGVTHKAVNFCICEGCPYLEQGVIFYNGKQEKFLNLEEIDIIFSKGKRAFWIRKS